MAIKLGDRSVSRLEGVDSQLVRVVLRAADMAEPHEDFTVLEGVRSKEQCWINYGKGRTVAECQAKGVPAKYAKPGVPKVTWLKDPLSSKHCFGEAVDLAPYPIDWNDLKRFDALNKLMEQAAWAEKVDIRWGADWDEDGNPRERGESDSPHWELG